MNMKKIILIVGGIILVAIFGRAIWAYQQVKNDEAKIANAPTSVAVPQPESVQVGIPVGVDASPRTAGTSDTLTVKNTQILDCKEDLNCFLKAMDSKCSFAKLIENRAMDVSGILPVKLIDFKMGAKILYEIKGVGGGTCIIHEKYLDTLLTYDSSKLSQQESSVKSMFQGLIDDVQKQAVSPNEDYVCKATSLELRQWIEDMTKGIIRDKYPYREACVKAKLN